MFQKTMRVSTLVGVLISSLATVKVNGTCERDVEEIYKVEGIKTSFEAMVDAYAKQCTTDNTCQFSNYEGTLVGVNKLVADSGGPEDLDLVELINADPDVIPEDITNLTEEEQAAIEAQLANQFDGIDQAELVENLKTNSPPIKLDATLDVSSFKTNETYLDYVSECTKLGAAITLVDIEFQAQGEKAFSDSLKEYTQDGLEVDVDIKMMGVPLCLSKTCDDQKDLAAVADKLLLNLLLEADLEGNLGEQSIDVPDNMDISQITNMASFDLFCTLGKIDGLEVCSFTVDRTSDVSDKAKATVLDAADKSDGKSKKTFGVMIAAVITLTSVLML